MLISVIVPVFNVKEYLVRCVESIENQDFKDFELILIDDGSTDGSAELCDRLATNYTNIIVFHQINKGVGAARNLGLSKMKGEHVIFVDADDTISPGYFSKVFDLRKYDIIKFGGLEQKNSERISYFRTLLKEHDFSRAVWQYVISSSFLKSSGVMFDEDLPIGEDELFLFCLLLRSREIMVSPDVYYNYESRPGSAIHKRFTMEDAERRLVIQKRMLEYMSSRYVPYENLIRRWVVNQLCYYYYCLFKIRPSLLSYGEARKEVKSFLASVGTSERGGWRYMYKFVFLSVCVCTVYVLIVKKVYVWMRRKF